MVSFPCVPDHHLCEPSSSRDTSPIPPLAISHRTGERVTAAVRGAGRIRGCGGRPTSAPSTCRTTRCRFCLFRSPSVNAVAEGLQPGADRLRASARGGGARAVSVLLRDDVQCHDQLERGFRARRAARSGQRVGRAPRRGARLPRRGRYRRAPDAGLRPLDFGRRRSALIEGFLLGLSLRARDHMRQGGLLSLETSLVELDRELSEKTGLPPGEYVRIGVADTGGWSGDAASAWTTRMGSSRTTRAAESSGAPPCGGGRRRRARLRSTCM